jgi:uncharacterized membrane protein
MAPDSAAMPERQAVETRVEALLLIAVLVLGFLLADTRRRLSRLEARLDAAPPIRQDAPMAARHDASPPAAAAEAVVRRRPPAFEPPAPPPVEKSVWRPAIPDLETLIGGRLPIWIGGVALVLAGFFLVRAAIDSGLLGPGVRVTMAALLAAVLAALSEVARRLPATRDDVRIGQVLAGAAVASAYGTLYLAAALYHLLSPLPAFILLLAITAAGLALAIRHGPPTAVMALVGGFLAPLVAGYDAAGIVPLFVYLALLTTALFVLAIRRGWGWLAIAAAAAGFGWTGFLTLALDGGDRPVVGLFVVALSLAASLSLPRAGAVRLTLRIAPMALGLAQLFLLAPILDFSPLGWSFYLVLGAASVALAWRQAALLPAALVAALLTPVLLTLAPAEPMTGAAAVIATLIFGGPGAWRSRDGRGWALLALTGIAGPVIVLHLGTPQLASRPVWAVAALAATGAALLVAWRHRDRAEAIDTGLVGGALVAGSCAILALAAMAGENAIGIGLGLTIVAIHFAGRRTGSGALTAAAAVPLLVSLGTAHRELQGFAAALGVSALGEELPYRYLASIADVLRMVLPPALAALVALRDPAGFGRLRAPAMAIGSGLLAISLYALTKQPLAIATPDAFATWGFVERAAITLVTLAIGWGLARRSIAPHAAALLLGIGLARILWFDLLVLSPVFTAQQVGNLPLLNAAVLLPGIAATLAWTWPGGRARIPALALMLVAALAAVRQVAHGTILTGPIGTGENWGYSAVMLGLGLIWLWRGIVTGARDLRFAGLGLVLAVALKVFTIDIALDGLLRVVSFLGIGITLIAISWAYTRFLKGDMNQKGSGEAPDDNRNP